MASRKAILITQSNKTRLLSSYVLDPFELDGYEDKGYYLVADFGDQTRACDILTEANLNAAYTRGVALIHDYFEVRKKP